MGRFKQILLIILSILFVGCTVINNNGKSNSIKPNEKSFIYNGVWKVEEYRDLTEGEIYTDEFKNNIIGQEVKISQDKIKILDTYRSNVKYKLKVVDKSYVISYEYNLKAKEFIGNKTKMDIISVIDNNTTLCEFFYLDDGRVMMLYKSLILVINKISDDVKFSESNDTLLTEENILYDILDKDVGVMIGIKKPRELQEDGFFSKDKYRTIWLPYKDEEIGNVYEKEDIIFPRVNGIWKIKTNETNANNNHVEYFEVSTLDGKVVLNKELESTNSLYKSINFIGNDYLALEKYEGDNFINKFNKYQIAPVDNINSNEGIRIDELYNTETNIIFENDRKNILENIPTEDRNMLNETIDYSNITMARNEGKWILKGKISPKNNKGEGLDFNLSLKPNNKLINFNSLLIPWKNLIGEVLFLEDAFTSPNNTIALIKFKEFIAAYKIENGGLKGAPIFSIPIDENEEIIMVEWCNGDYIAQWQNAFKDGKLIEEQ